MLSASASADFLKQRIHRVDVLQQLGWLRHRTLLARGVGMRPDVSAALIVQALDLAVLHILHNHHAIESADRDVVPEPTPAFRFRRARHIGDTAL